MPERGEGPKPEQVQPKITPEQQREIDESREQLREQKERAQKSRAEQPQQKPSKKPSIVEADYADLSDKKSLEGQDARILREKIARFTGTEQANADYSERTEIQNDPGQIRRGKGEKFFKKIMNWFR